MGMAIVYLEEDTEMTQASSTRFLIVGAAGSHGATGNHMARQLLARGLPVRAFVRQADERADKLGELGPEIAVRDISDYEVPRPRRERYWRLRGRTRSSGWGAAGVLHVPAGRWPSPCDGHLRCGGKADGLAI